MAFRGRKIADVYAELHLDRDDAKSALRGIPGELGGDADRAGQELGKRVTDGLARAVEQGSARIAKARRAEVDAANAVKVAELRLNEAREKGNRPASQLLALEQALEKAQYRLAESNKAATAAVTKHADAERRLGESLRTIADRAGPDADRAGREVGGKLSQGIHLSIVRNSPLIAAAIGGALAAGAPVALAGATGLFAGIGIVSQAQSVKVRSAWTDAWTGIKEDAFTSSTSLQPVLVGLADRVEQSFHQMAPSLREAFEAAAPQVDVFADGVLGLATNALPGLQRAVERSMPVTEGLASFLEKTGTGLTGFFDAMSEHAPAAGEAFAAIGDIVAELLPTLGQLLGQGAELASIVLPPLAKILGVVADGAEALGPLLPAISAGFLGMKIASSVATGVGSLGDKLTRLKGSITPTNAALGVMGTVIGLTVAAMQESDAQTDKWAAALEEGGAAARQATAEMSAHQRAVDEASSGLTGFGQTLMGTSGFLSIYADDTEKAKQAAEDWYNALTPQARATEDVKRATSDLADALDRYGPGSREAERASDALTAAQKEQERAQSELEQAIDGVTSAMIAQAEQALAAANSDYAYRQSLEGVDDQVQAIADAQRDQQEAVAALDEANRTYGAGSDEVADAQRNLRDATERTSDATSDLEGSILAAADAAGRMAADALPAGTSELKLQQAAAAASLAELVRMRTEMGSNFPPALNAAIARLQASGVTMDTVGQQAVNATGRLQALGAQRPQPVAYLNSVPFFSAAAATQNRMNYLNALRASPLAFLYANTSSAEGQLNWAARNRTSYVTQYVQQVLSTIPLFHADGGAIEGMAGGGAVRGPGGPRDDLIAAIAGSRPIRLSNGEHVLDAEDVNLLGGQAGVYAFRSRLNAGRPQLVAPRGMANGGDPATAGGGTATATRSGSAVHIAGNVVLQIPGAYNLGTGTDKKRLLNEIREGLIGLDRQQS